jgi:glycosyltransferase involved in cell wall biosynthesis
MTLSYPLVSVITPTYNRADDYLRETIDSVLAQDYPNFEYLVLDDGSTDNTREVIEQYSDPRMTYYYHDNMGEAQTVNKGFRLAKGDYILVVNSDDPILSGLLSEAVRILEESPDALVAYPDWQMIDEKSEPFQHIQTMDPYNYVDMLRQSRCVPGPGAMIRRRAIELESGRDISLKYVGDTDFWLRVGLHGPFIHLPQTLACHRIHSGTLTSNLKFQTVNPERIRMMDKIYGHAKMPEAGQRVKREAYAAAHYIIATQYLKDIPGAAYHFFRSIWLSPFRCQPAGLSRRWGLMLRVITVAILPSFLHRPYYRVNSLLGKTLRKLIKILKQGAYIIVHQETNRQRSDPNL